MEFRILGPLEVVDDGRKVASAGSSNAPCSPCSCSSPTVSSPVTA
jgi:hypothetical protein